jgi:hypothetical protein
MKKIWDYCVAHPIWSKVVASILSAAIIALLVWLWSIILKIPFSAALSSFFHLKIALWICLLSNISIVYLTIWVVRQVRSSNVRPAENGSITASRTSTHTLPANSTITESPTSSVPKNIIFDSSISYSNFYKGYGRQEWDTQRNQLVGGKGEGTWSFEDKTITIHRSNIAGRFVIEINQYFFRGTNVNIIPTNIFGRSPRNFKVQFKARALSGQHRVRIVFRNAKTKKIESEPEFELSNIEFRPQYAGVAIGADLQFTIEIHTWSVLPDTTLQISDLKIEESA